MSAAGADRSALARLAAPLCALVGCCCYVPALGAGRLADDFVLERTVHRVTGALWPFTHNDLGQAAGAGHFYRPLWVLWNAGVNAISAAPAFAHLMNLVLFAVICAEVVILLRSLLPTREALLGGLLFAVLPYHGESVAWISGNTDLLAVALGLPALILASRDELGESRLGRGRLPAIACLAALAGLAKEIALVLPVIAALLLWARPASDPPAAGRWRPVLAMLGASACVLALRLVVLGGLGGYSSPFTPRRGIGALVSFSLGALSAPQMELLAHPAWLLVPAALLALIVAAGVRARRSPASPRRRLAIVGIAWFLVAIAPVLNQPLNLNTRNGDRLLLLPSVGLVLFAGGLIPARGRRRWGAVALALTAGAGLSLLDAAGWQRAGTESTRILADIRRIAPAEARLVALTVPTDLGAAHLFPDGLDVALGQTGRPDLTLSTCMPVHVVHLGSGEISAVAGPPGRWTIRTSAAAPFDVPVLGGAVASTGCVVGPSSGSAGLGTRLHAEVLPAGPAEALLFDGLDMRRAPAP